MHGFVWVVILFNERIMKIRLIGVFFLLLSLHIQAAKAVDKHFTQDQLTYYLINHKQQQLSLLKKLVNINSGTANSVGVYQVGEILRPLFQQLGFKTHWVKEPSSMRRAGTLVIERKGHKGKRLLLIGHLDTVFPVNSPFQYFKQRGNLATGPGVLDDKGGVVVILYALKALYTAHILDDATITVILTGDEEDSGKPTTISRKPLIDAARHSDIALDYEWAITLDTATIARRGITDWEIRTEGNEAHSSKIFQKPAGDGAIYELARILNTMRTQLANEEYLSFNPGLILGGTAVKYENDSSRGKAFGKGNVIAKIAMAKGDLRFLLPEQKSSVERKIKEIVDQHLLGTTAIVNFQDGIPSMQPTAANLELLKKYSEVSQQLGYGVVKPLNPELRGAGDISHIASLVSANLAGLGPVGTGAHSVKETLDIHSLSIQTQRTALLIYRLIS